MWLIISYSEVTSSSVIAVQIFDQRKFKKKDQGFLGVVNIPVSKYLDLTREGNGMQCFHSLSVRAANLTDFM